MENLKDVVSSGKNGFQKLIEKIPGVSGYTKKEDRRDTDKIVRETIAKRFEEQWSRIGAIQRDLIKKGDLSAVSDLETAALKIRQFADRIKTASYGYAGLFDAVKVDEAALDQLYDYDLYLFQLSDTVEESITAVENAITAADNSLNPAIETLIKVAGDSVTAFNRRSEVITGTVNS